MDPTAADLRAALAASRPARASLGFPTELRGRVGGCLSRRHAVGDPWTALSRALGISATTARKWGLTAAEESTPASSGFVPVVVAEHDGLDEDSDGLVLHTPYAYRVTGARPHQLIELLRGLEWSAHRGGAGSGRALRRPIYARGSLAWPAWSSRR